MTDPNVTLQTICAPSEDVVARVIEDELIIVPLASGIGDADDELYTLNPTGQAIWQKLNGARTLAQIADELAGEFDGTRADIERDMLGMVGELARRKMVVAQ
ncbi:MAG: PqqD family protein [Chloroflexi bacterium]|nr:PqqD family protein [Chloroflexota bacterium]